MIQNLTRAARTRRTLMLAAWAIAAAAPAAHAAGATPVPPPPLKVAFVYVSPVGDAGWTYQHDLGRRQMEAALGTRVQATVVESVPEGADAERVLRDLVAQGNRLIFATSFGYLEPALRVAADHPEVVFEHAGGYRTAANVNTYNARYYEARYLAGMLAASATRTGTAGYVAGFPVPEVIQGINAFTLGMRAVRPDAQVRVVWLNTWFDPAREREAALTLIAQGADVLTNHSASPAVALAAQEKRVKVIGYQSDMRRFAPDAQLTAIVHQWGAHYTHVAQSVLDGTWQPRPVWGGLGSGLVALAPFHPTVPVATVKVIRTREAEIIAGRFLPFSGRLLDNTGRERNDAGPMGDAALSVMNWFVHGVVGSVPKP